MFLKKNKNKMKLLSRNENKIFVLNKKKKYRVTSPSCIWNLWIIESNTDVIIEVYVTCYVMLCYWLTCCDLNSSRASPNNNIQQRSDKQTAMASSFVKLDDSPMFQKQVPILSYLQFNSIYLSLQIYFTHSLDIIFIPHFPPWFDWNWNQ